MIFLFSNLIKRKSINCNLKNTSGSEVLSVSPLVETLYRLHLQKIKFKNFDTTNIRFDTMNNRKNYKKYVLATGVTHSPNDWTGYLDLGYRFCEKQKKGYTPFYYLDKKSLGAIKKKKAFLLLDQTHEGYHSDWLFDWFHKCIEVYDLLASQIIYVTGNFLAEDQYKKYCTENYIEDKMLVLGHAQFEELIYINSRKRKTPSVEEHIEYKSQCIEKIYAYNCFQKRIRPHRIWMFYKLYKNDLLADGITSMNFFNHRDSFYNGKIIPDQEYLEFSKILPIYPRNDLTPHLKTVFESSDSGQPFINDLYQQEALNSWVSVVSEASFAEDTCFISEKTFKPIATRHPFIIYGNKHSLKYLKKMGYKTFEGFIDEQYDNLDSWDRLDAIVNEIKKIKALSNNQKLEWFNEMKHILNYNYDLMEFNTKEQISESIVKLYEYVGNK
jgi:hypothetical protein